MATRGAIWGAAAALALAGCATGGNLAHAERGIVAANQCFEAANGRFDRRRGMAACDNAIASNTRTPALLAATLVNRGIILMDAEAFDAALNDFDAAIAIAPNSADALVNKGVLLTRIGGRDAEAVAVFTEALEHNPARPALVYYHRAGAYEALGRLRDAYDDYAEAAQLAPDWAEPAHQLQRFKFVRRKTMTG